MNNDNKKNDGDKIIIVIKKAMIIKKIKKQ